MEVMAAQPPDRLQVPAGDKHRSFSTSTPFCATQEQKLRCLSVSVCSTTSNDSGLGASLQEISVTSFADISKPCPAVTFSMYKTPTDCVGVTFQPFPFDISASPISSKCFSIRKVNADSSCRRSFLARRSLDSDTSLNEEGDSFELGQRTFNCSISSGRESLDTSFRRKLDFDLDIYNLDNEKSHSASKPYTPTPQERQLSEKFDSILQKFSPSEPDRLIGRRMGREQVDVLSELSSMNISCVSSILSFLEPRDLCRMCRVSSEWKRICETDSVANSRRKGFLRHNRNSHRKLGKENAGKRVLTRQSRSESVPLQDLSIQQPCAELPELCAGKTTTDQFMDAASRLKNDEKLQKCPKCRKPAKVLPVQDRGRCENPDCGYDYCTKCNYEFHGSKDCVPIVSKKTKTDAIGTRKSKKNLKRL